MIAFAHVSVGLVCGALSIALAGCGSSSSMTTSTRPATFDAAVPLDVCALLSADEVTALLGVPVDGAPSDSFCMWENPDNLESVSIQIGSPDTAINGTLPPPEEGFPDLTTPGPDGMRFIGPGAIEFAAGGRSNVVQVAVLSMLGDGAADDAAADLARRIGPKIPQP